MNTFDNFTLPSPEPPEAVVPQNIVVEDDASEQTNKSKIWIFLCAGFIILALVAGVFIYRKNTSVTVAKPVITPTPTQTPTPKPVNLSEYKIKVLNGSGVSGEATKVQTLLEGEKFVVSSIGNGDNSDYEKTVIQTKITVPKEFSDKLKILLEKTYVLDADKTLDASSESDVSVIIGSKLTTY